MISFYSLIIAAPIPILLALMINEVQSKGIRKAIQTSVYLPHFISVVVVAGIVVALLVANTGLVNNALSALGFRSHLLPDATGMVPNHLHRLGHLEGGRLRFDHLPGGDHGHQPGACTNRRRLTARHAGK